MADDVATIQPEGRRQQHKLRTERALQKAALELFATFGYDTTTTDEIAERAGVSPRTFFRYFPTKESVLFVGEYGWIQSFTKQYLAQPASVGDVDAMRDALVSSAPGISSGRRSLRLYDKAVATSPTLRGRVQDHIAENIGTLADAVAARRGLVSPDEGCSLFAAVALVTYRRALNRWLAGPASFDLADVIHDEFDLLVTLSAGTGSGRPDRKAARGQS